MAYQPLPDSLEAQVIAWLQMHAGGKLDLDAIVELGGLRGGTSVHTRLARALDAGVLKRSRDAEGNYWYSAGPALTGALSGVSPEVGRGVGGGSGRKPRRYGLPTAVEICDDPLVDPGKALRRSALQSTFESLKVGQCIKCAPDDAMRIAHALERWARNYGPPDAVVKRVKNYPGDGQGRVWLLAAEVPAVAATKAAKRT